MWLSLRIVDSCLRHQTKALQLKEAENWSTKTNLGKCFVYFGLSLSPRLNIRPSPSSYRWGRLKCSHHLAWAKGCQKSVMLCPERQHISLTWLSDARCLIHQKLEWPCKNDTKPQTPNFNDQYLWISTYTIEVEEETFHK